MRISVARVIALGLLVLTALVAQGGTAAMAQTRQLDWQGAADRTPVRFLILRVDRVGKEGGGLLGLGNSPSLAGSFPDATDIDASAPDGPWRLRGPGAELPQALGRGDRIAVGLVDDSHFICVLRPPSELAEDDVAAWAKARPLR